MTVTELPFQLPFDFPYLFENSNDPVTPYYPLLDWVEEQGAELDLGDEGEVSNRGLQLVVVEDGVNPTQIQVQGEDNGGREVNGNSQEVVNLNPNVNTAGTIIALGIIGMAIRDIFF